MYFLRSTASRTVGSFEDRSTRRSATVTISAPEAARAARVSSSDLYLPVPTISREVSVRSPSFQESVISASSDEGHDLEPITVGEEGGRMLGTWDDLEVALDGDALVAEAELAEEP